MKWEKLAKNTEFSNPKNIGYVDQFAQFPDWITVI
jgi:hypothetical protein